MTKAEVEAGALFENFDLTIPIDPQIVCERISSRSLKIHYHEKEIQTENVCGLTIRDGDNIHIFVNSLIALPARRLFTAAHELGHVILHIQTGVSSKTECSNNDIHKYDGNDIETDANRFASALLMPSHLVKDVVNKNDLTWAFVKDLAQQYGTSLEATARRTMNITKDPYALIIHEKGTMLYAIKSHSFPAVISKHTFPKYLQYQIYDKFTMTTQFQKCDPLDFGLYLNPKNNQLYYSSIHFESHSRTMTLLCIEETDDFDNDWEPPKF